MLTIERRKKEDNNNFCDVNRESNDQVYTSLQFKLCPQSRLLVKWRREDDSFVIKGCEVKHDKDYKTVGAYDLRCQATSTSTMNAPVTLVSR